MAISSAKILVRSRSGRDEERRPGDLERKFFPGYVLVEMEMTTTRGTWSRARPR